MSIVGKEVKVKTDFGNGPIEEVIVTGEGKHKGRPVINYVDQEGCERWAYTYQIVEENNQ